MRSRHDRWLFKRERLQATRDPRALRAMLAAAERHVHQAVMINWPALAYSWQRDVDAIKARMAALREEA